jgi:coenzyme F420-reducing hydrogenase beta subunit
MQNSHIEKHLQFKEQDEAKIEQQFLKGTRDEDLGVYCGLFSAKSGIEGQDGGVVSAMLAAGFEDGPFDSAVVVRRLEGYSAEAFVAKNASDVLAAKGTKYLKVNVTAKLKELIKEGKKKIAIVCTPCEAKLARKIQQTLKSDAKITVIGLFCFEAFNHAKLKEEVKSRLGVDLDRCDKTQIRQGKFNLSLNGQEYSCKVKDLDAAAERACRFCSDFTSRFADVSVGSVGSKQGFSTVITRSPIGEKLAGKLGGAKETANKEEIVKVAKFKVERAKKNFSNLKSPL